MLKFDDEEIQKAFDECHFRQEYDGVDICRGMCQPCLITIDTDRCVMLKEYFSKQKEKKNEKDIQ